MRLGVRYRYHRDQDMGHFVILKNGSLGAIIFNSKYLLCCMCACVYVLCCANTTVTITLIWFFILVTELGSQPEQIFTFDFECLTNWVTQQ